MDKIWTLDMVVPHQANSASHALPPLFPGNKRSIGVFKRPTLTALARAFKESESQTHVLPVKQDMMVTGHSPKILRTHSSHPTYRSPEQPHKSVSALSVREFLADNPDFLENYILQNVSLHKLESWCCSKGRIDFSAAAKPSEESLGDKWQSFEYTSKRRLLQNLMKESQTPDKTEGLVFELGMCMSSAINANGVNVYLVNNEACLQCYQSPKFEETHSNFLKVERGATIAGYVAVTKESVLLTDTVTEDARFPAGTPIITAPLESVIAIPILKISGDTLGVMELYKFAGGSKFTQSDQETATKIAIWGNLALYFEELYNSMMRQRKQNDFLLAVTKSIFQDIVSMDTVIMKIMTHAKRLVNADRTSLFLVDNRTNELYARIFDTGNREHTQPNPIFQKEIRFPIDKGVAGHVATTGDVLNIPDAYVDERFNREVDQQTGYKTQTILCMPICIRGSVIGVVQMVNKIDGTFTKFDEQAFETFATYCGLALHHAKLYDKIRKSEQKYRVALEVLSYHRQSSEEEIKSLENRRIPDHVENIANFDYSPWDVCNEDKPVYIIYMFRDLFNFTRFDVNDLIRFTLTVRKNYRHVPYHNWTHAFSVAHGMYTILRSTEHKFVTLEAVALFVACMCHDLDHRGKTNAFMVKSSSPLAAVYSTSTMEHHHFNQTVTILQHEGHNIFKHLTSEEYKQVLSDIRHNILATDLALFFGNKDKLQKVSSSDSFDWKNVEHRQLLMSLSMTACDLCAMYKSWELQQDLVQVIMEEFWQQGDLEKERGIQPLTMMDRDHRDELPELEVNFICGICMPCYDLLVQIIPETQPMADGTRRNLQRWKDLAAEYKANCLTQTNESEKPNGDSKEYQKDAVSDSEDEPCNQAAEETDSGDTTIEIVRDSSSNLRIGMLPKLHEDDAESYLGSSSAHDHSQCNKPSEV